MNRDQLVNDIRNGEVITRVDFAGVDLSGLDLSGAVMERVGFAKANLTGAKMRQSRSDPKSGVLNAQCKHAVVPVDTIQSLKCDRYRLFRGFKMA